MEDGCASVSPLPASSSNMGFLDGSLPDLEGRGYRASTMEEKINEVFVQVAKLPLLTQSVSRLEICVQAFSHTVASYDAKITNIEQMVSSLAAGASTLETNATSVSSGSGSASSWNTLGHGDGSTVTGTLLSHGGHLMTIEIQDEGLIRSQDPKVNNHEVPFYYCSLANKTTNGLQSGSIFFGKNPICQHTTNEAGSVSVRLVFETRAKCQDSVARYKLIASLFN